LGSLHANRRRQFARADAASCQWRRYHRLDPRSRRLPQGIERQTKIVPGHGALAKKADLVAWREMLVTSRDRIQKLVNEGKTEQEVVAAKPLADLDAKWAANAAGPELDPHGLQLIQAVVTTAPKRRNAQHRR
jgi:hypothetical protein